MTNIIDRKNKGIYVFEGIDNVGKTTIVDRLKVKIKETTEYECYSFSFPGNEPKTLGRLVYDMHHCQEKYFNLPLNEASLQLLHIASHIDLIQRKLIKLNSSRSIILLDRFWWSTYVYGLVGELREDMVQAIIAPELMYWKKLNVKRIFLLEREKRNFDYEIKKDAKIVNIYRDLAQHESKCVTLNNNGSIEEIVDKIYNNILGE